MKKKVKLKTKKPNPRLKAGLTLSTFHLINEFNITFYMIKVIEVLLLVVLMWHDSVI